MHRETESAPPLRGGGVNPALLAALCLLAFPAQASDLLDEWRDLHDRCADAVTAGEPLDVSGLTPLFPAFLVAPVEVDLAPPAAPEPPAPDLSDPGLIGGEPPDYDVIGRRLEERGRILDAEDVRERLTPAPMSSDRQTRFERRVAQRDTVGEWGRPEGRMILRLLEYPTRAGSRAICEVTARPAVTVSVNEALTIGNAFAALHRLRNTDVDAADGGTVRVVATVDEDGPRGCRIVASVTRRNTENGAFFRSSVGEAVGRPDCGGASLFGEGGLNPADVVER